MPDGPALLSHLLVVGRSADEAFHRSGRGDARVRPVEDRAGHGQALREETNTAFDDAATRRSEIEQLTDDELRALGSIVTLEGADPTYPLRVDSLERRTRHRESRPQWLLLSVLPPDAEHDQPERAVVWVSDEYRDRFLKLFEDYVERDTPTGQPRNRELLANIGRIRATILHDLWQSSGEPDAYVRRWWELWLRPTDTNVELLRRYAEGQQVRVSPRVLTLADRVVVWVEATWAQLEPLPFTAVPVAEIRRPEFVDSIEDLPAEEQDEYVVDLQSRVQPADRTAPAVCHLDTGVARTHVLLAPSLDAADLHTVIGISGFDRDGHGTKMAGLALYGSDIEDLLTTNRRVQLRHGLESVRILPARGEARTNPLAFGDVTAQAVALPETVSRRARVYCMPVTSHSDDSTRPGQPTLWSATVDALSAGVDVVRDGDQLTLLGAPDPAACRLIIVSAGNVDTYEIDHLAVSDVSAVEDPAQAWNALTVGAVTDFVGTPTDVQYSGWSCIAPAGELSPHSRTSLLFGTRPWPIKPEVVLEGGNVLSDGTIFEGNLPLLSLRTTSHMNDTAISSANATSAATAQAARLAALTMATYPSYWPETVRALIVHAAEWTPAMRAQIDTAARLGKEAAQRMLRRYGWGVPTEESVLHSSNQAVTLVVQDQFTPFVGDDYRAPTFRLHRLPWPAAVLEQLDAADVTLRVTLSYFVEPTASRRGWRQRYAYASHGLRFEIQEPLENEQHFLERVNRDAHNEASGSVGPTSSTVDWLLGSRHRAYGSLHQDIWETSGQELAQSGSIAVYPVGGWWKNSRSKDRLELPVRYALVVSLRTPRTDVDIYTPIAIQLGLPIAIDVPIE